MQKSVRQCALETRVSGSSVQRILKTAEFKCYIPILPHATNEGDSDLRKEYCEWFNGMVRNNEVFTARVRKSGTLRPFSAT